MEDSQFGLFDSPCVGTRPHVRDSVKLDIHIKPKSYKLELLGVLVCFSLRVVEI